MPLLVEVVRAGQEHLEAIFELYCETAEWHVSMDPTYYVAVDDGEAAGVRNAFREALTDSSGASGAHVAVGPQGAALGFVLWSIEREGYHDTHFQAVGVIEEVYVRPASRRQAGGWRRMAAACEPGNSDVRAGWMHQLRLRRTSGSNHTQRHVCG